MQAEARKGAHSAPRFSVSIRRAAGGTQSKKKTVAAKCSALFPPSNSLPPQKNNTKDMDAHKLTGRLALAAVAVAAMQVSGVEREGREEGKGG